jgi:hypothetical protein
MFRSGGSTGEGITSGLAPRQGYDIGGLTDSDIAEIRKQSRELTQGNRKADMNQFLIDFGLNMVSGTPKGNIFATAAESAKDPMATMQQTRASRGAAESDMFATLFKGAIDAKGTAQGGKGWLEQWKFQQIPVLNEKINRLSQKETDGTITPEEELELQNSRDQKARIVSISPVLEGYLKNNKYIVQDEMARLFEEDSKLPEEERKYKGKRDLQLELDAIDNVERRYMATGGRVGYQEGMSVMPTTMPAQEQTMPEELGNVSYDELRARLPQEVSDEVVQLLANSAEALEDFATIQTEQDIANFNKKYGVNLVLPAEG